MLDRLYRLFFSRTFSTFLFVGFIAASANFITRKFTSDLIGFSWSIFVGYFVGASIAFTLNRYLTFRGNVFIQTHGVGKQLNYFIFVNLVGFVQTFLVSLVLRALLVRLHENMKVVEDVAHFCGLAAPTFSSYVAHNYISFGKYGVRGFVRELVNKTTKKHSDKNETFASYPSIQRRRKY